MKDILINSLNGFAVSDIPMFIFQLLVSALLVRLVQMVWHRQFTSQNHHYAVVIGLVFTFVAIIAKFSLPFAVLFLAILIWVGKAEKQSETDRLFKLIIGLIGIGVGSFNIVLTILLTGLVLLIIWLVPNKENG